MNSKKIKQVKIPPLTYGKAALDTKTSQVDEKKPASSNKMDVEVSKDTTDAKASNPQSQSNPKKQDSKLLQKDTVLDQFEEKADMQIEGEGKGAADSKKPTSFSKLDYSSNLFAAPDKDVNPFLF